MLRLIPSKRVVIAAVGVFYAVCITIAKEPDESSEDNPIKFQEDPVAWVRELADGIVMGTFTILFIACLIVFTWLDAKIRSWLKDASSSSKEFMARIG